MNRQEIDKLDNKALRSAGKKAGLKVGKMSLLQIRDGLEKAKDQPKTEKKAKGPREPKGKMAIAIKLFLDNKKLERQEILALFISKAKLTKAGANTYYSVIKNKNR